MKTINISHLDFFKKHIVNEDSHTVVGSNEMSLFIKEILYMAKNSIEGLSSDSELWFSIDHIRNSRKQSRNYIAEQSEKFSITLKNLTNLNEHIYSELEIRLQEKNDNEHNPTLNIKGDKEKAMQLVKKLKENFGFYSIVIGPTDNWDKVSFWAKNTAKCLNKFMKILNLPKEAINLNGKLSLAYTSPLYLRNHNIFGMCSCHQNGYYTLSFQNSDTKSLLCTLIHEYTHLFDIASLLKYKSKYGIETNIKELSTLVLYEAIDGNTSFNDPFLNEYQKNIVNLVNKNDISDLSNYSKIYQDFSNPIKEIFLSTLIGTLKDKSDVCNISPNLDEVINTLVNKWAMLNKTYKKEFKSYESTINDLAINLSKNEIEYKYILSNKDKLPEALDKIIHSQIKKYGFFQPRGIDEKQGCFGNTPYIKKIINHCIDKNLRLNYYTSINEILACHTQAITKENLDKYKEDKIIYTTITKKEKKLYKNLIRDMVLYSQLVSDKNLHNDSVNNVAYVTKQKLKK